MDDSIEDEDFDLSDDDDDFLSQSESNESPLGGDSPHAQSLCVRGICPNTSLWAENDPFCPIHTCEWMDSETMESCLNKKARYSNFCYQHRDENECHVDGCRDVKLAGGNFCYYHTCRSEVPGGCMNRKDRNHFCREQHQCTFVDCCINRRAGSNFCGVHNCHTAGCGNPVVRQGALGCQEHGCHFPNCEFPRQGNELYCVVHNYWGAGPGIVQSHTDVSH